MKSNSISFFPMLVSKLALITALFAMAFTFSSTAVASGGGGGGGGGFGGGGFGGGGSAPQARPVDQNYEIGKAIYRGRGEGIPKLSYCVKSEGDEMVPIKGKSVKPYKRGTYTEFASALYNCDEPSKRIADELKRDDFLYVIYYLNKRHNLKLVGS